MAQAMGGDLLFDATSSSGFSGSPLHATGTELYRLAAATFAVEEVACRSFSFKISLNATDEQLTEGYIAILSAFTLADVQGFTIKINIVDLEIAELKIAQTAAIE